MKDFQEEPITREDRFMREMFVALIEEVQNLRQEIKELKKNEPKRKTHAKSGGDNSNAE